MKRAGRYAVQVGLVFAADGAETVQIEVRVAKLKGIKCPLNEADSAAKRLVALEEFQLAANAAVAVVAVHPSHVGMEVSNAVAQANDRERIANQAVAIATTKNLAATVRGADEHCDRRHFQIRFPPNFPC